MNGFGKSDTFFKNNNRIKKISLDIRERNTDTIQTEFFLKDQKEFQSIKFEKSCVVSRVIINNDGKDESLYKGDKYDDTCITEIEFYNQGKKISIKNMKEAKKDYLDRVGGSLEARIPSVQNEYIKYKWKVEENKLYRYKNDKWLLTKYFISSDDTIEVFDENGNCNKVGKEYDTDECCRFDLKVKK